MGLAASFVLLAPILQGATAAACLHALAPQLLALKITPAVRLQMLEVGIRLPDGVGVGGG
eukprot:SAG11_NODE_32554_length_282_cov_1.693989_1_plen_59_part_01